MCWLQSVGRSSFQHQALGITSPAPTLRGRWGGDIKQQLPRSGPGQAPVKWGLNCHTSELQNLNKNGMLRLHFRITF